MGLVFVGEKRSNKAISMGVTWNDGRLCARTLHRALRGIGINPTEVLFTNAYHDGDGYTADSTALKRVGDRALAGDTVVALGRRVSRTLRQSGVAHLYLVHPAARGQIRAAHKYQQHVASVLGTDHD